jgi:hypothetical protein
LENRLLSFGIVSRLVLKLTQPTKFGQYRELFIQMSDQLKLEEDLNLVQKSLIRGDLPPHPIFGSNT